MSKWIKMSSSLNNGLKAIEFLDNEKFHLLVNHVCSALQLGNEMILGQEEKKKLSTWLIIKEDTLELILCTIQLIYLSATYGIVQPAAMEDLMIKDFDLSEEKVSIFVNCWMLHGKKIIERCGLKSIYPVQVDDLNWQLNIRSSSSALPQEVTPVVWLHLGLIGSKENSKLTVEMDKNDLTMMYNKFEDLQRQLDQLEQVREKTSA